MRDNSYNGTTSLATGPTPLPPPPIASPELRLGLDRWEEEWSFSTIWLNSGVTQPVSVRRGKALGNAVLRQLLPGRPTWLTTNERVARHRHHPASITRVVADTVASFTDITPHTGEYFDLQRRGARAAVAWLQAARERRGRCAHCHCRLPIRENTPAS